MLVDLNDKNILGESPIWNNHYQSFFWVDIEDYKIKKYNEKDLIEVFPTSLKPTCIANYNNNLVVVLEKGVGIYDFRDKNGVKMLIDKKWDQNIRFNDGKCDRNGNLYFGSMSLDEPRKNNGKIYKLNKNLQLDEIIGGIHVSNGISFSVDNSKMYYSDTPQETIYQLYNHENNNDSNKSIFYKVNGRPDGSTVDCLDNYYSCLWDGFGIEVIGSNPSFIETNKRFTTCCSFGGKDLDKLFITSAYNNDKDIGSPVIKDMKINGILEADVSI